MCDDYPQAGLEAKIKQKIIDLQHQLLRHYAEPGFKLADNDLIRYSAMVEVLKAVLQ